MKLNLTCAATSDRMADMCSKQVCACARTATVQLTACVPLFVRPVEVHSCDKGAKFVTLLEVFSVPAVLGSVVEISALNCFLYISMLRLRGEYIINIRIAAVAIFA